MSILRTIKTLSLLCLLAPLPSIANEMIPYDQNSLHAKERKAQYRNIAKALTPEDRETWKRIGKKYRIRIQSETKGLDAEKAQALEDKLKMQMFTEIVQNISPEAVQAIMATSRVKEGHEPLSGIQLGEHIQ